MYLLEFIFEGVTFSKIFFRVGQKSVQESADYIMEDYPVSTYHWSKI